MAIGEQRKGEIALAFLRHKMWKDGLRFFPEQLKREAGNIAKAINKELRPEAQATVPELLEMYRDEMRRIQDEAFAEAEAEK